MSYGFSAYRRLSGSSNTNVENTNRCRITANYWNIALASRAVQNTHYKLVYILFSRYALLPLGKVPFRIEYHL